LQRQRTNLQAATYRRNDDSSASPVGPLPSEEHVKALKEVLATKADLQAQVQKLHLVQHQLKDLKHSEKASWKQAKKAENCQDKASWRAEKAANKHQRPHCRR